MDVSMERLGPVWSQRGHVSCDFWSCGFSLSSLRCFSSSFPRPLFVLPVRGPRAGSLDPVSHQFHILGASALPVSSMESLPPLSLGLCLLWWGLHDPWLPQPPGSDIPWDFRRDTGSSSLLGVPCGRSGCPLTPLCSLPAHPTEHQVPRGLLRGALGNTRSAPLLLPNASGGSRGLPEGSSRTLPAAPASAHLCTDSGPAAHRTSLAAVHPPPDTLFSWVFQLLFLIFLALLPGSALQAFLWSRGRGCGRPFPPRQPAQECA